MGGTTGGEEEEQEGLHGREEHRGSDLQGDRAKSERSTETTAAISFAERADVWRREPPSPQSRISKKRLTFLLGAKYLGMASGV